MKTIRIGNKEVGEKKPTFIIAEAGCNYEGSYKIAEEMVKAAARAGADAIKFQTFDPDKLVTKRAPKFWDIPGPGKTQYEEFKETLQLNLVQYKKLKKIANRHGILLFSTPSDEKSADMLEELGVPAYKIASMDITHLPFLRYVARKGKPIILSTGASTLNEIEEAVRTTISAGNDNIILLHCISNYPTNPKNVNLKMMTSIMKKFPDFPVGYSDHTTMPESRDIIIAAVAMGAKVIEKHFTFDKTRPGYDHKISADYDDLKNIVQSIRTVEMAMGTETKKPLASEKKVRIFGRRSLVAAKDIPKGTLITKEMITIKRPGTGIQPKFIDKVIGRKAKKNIHCDEVLKWEMIS